MLELHSDISTIQVVDNKIYTRRISGTDLAIFRQRINISVEGKIVSSQQIGGFTSINNLNSVGYGSLVDVKIPFEEAYNGTVYPVKISRENMNKVLSGNAHLMDRGIIEFKDYNVDKILDDEMFLMDTGRQLLYDRYYNQVVIPIYFDYISEHLDNEHYDLDSAIDILKQDVHVVNRESIKIIDIPCYNANEYCNKTIELQYLPELEDYKKYLGIYREDSWKAARFMLEDVIGLTRISE